MAPELVVWVSNQAGEASRAFQALKKHGEPVACNAAVLIRDRTGQAFVFETGNVDLQHGALLGTITGLLVELLGGSGPERVVAQGEHLTALRASLQPGGSALVILVDGEQIEGAFRLLAAFQGQVWQQTLADDLLAQLTTGLAPEEG